MEYLTEDEYTTAVAALKKLDVLINSPEYLGIGLSESGDSVLIFRIYDPFPEVGIDLPRRIG